jgi:DNA-binding response OmpR family regulator
LVALTEAEMDPVAGVLQPSILIVEDNVMIRNLLRMALVTQGYDVLEASNLQGALELQSMNPASIVVDLDLKPSSRALSKEV